MDPAAVLSALADLAPAGEDRNQALDVVGDGSLHWLPDPRRVPRTPVTERLIAVDALHQRERLLRRGWVFVCGMHEINGAKRRVRFPLLAEPVRLRPSGDGYRVVPAGDLRLTPLVTDQKLAARLEAAEGAGTLYWLTWPETRVWIEEAAAAAGLAIARVRMLHAEGAPPEEALMAGDPVAMAGAALFVARDVYSGSLRDTLLSWAGRSNLSGTALAACYGGAGSTELADERPVRSPLPLSAAQAEVVRRARSEPLTVVSGPPGSGKSHAVVAAALELVNRGASVLVATRSVAAAEALAQLLDRYPGPPPVRFGDAEHRDAAADAILARLGHGSSQRELKVAWNAVEAAADRVGRLTTRIDTALSTERRVDALAEWEPLLPALRAAAPRAFHPDTDLDAVARLARQGTRPGPWGRSALRRLQRVVGAAPDTSPAQVRAAVSTARALRDAVRLVAAGGTDLTAAWHELHEAEATLAAAVGAAMRHYATARSRWGSSARDEAMWLVAALRLGRQQRRHQLALIARRFLVTALPLWVGTVADTEDLLPPLPGLFDLAILDEASYLDQPQAALVLARARRAVVVGDPRQLRSVSFLPDREVAAVLDRRGLDARLDVRRVSAFDLAAGAAPVTWLGEHYRSVPHLIGFSADRFYAGRLRVATRHPANELRIAIEVVRVPEVDLEVSAAVAQVRRLGGQRAGGIAVVSPFRAHADALEEALLAAFPAAQLAEWGVRVGTVHAFQGGEAAVVVAALGLAGGDAPGRLRFAADPHLFNLLITRAREWMVVVTALGDPGGIIGDYLRYAERGPTPPPVGEPDHAWTAALAAELRRAGLAVRCGYPVGDWHVDMCVGEGAAAVGLATRVHPDGPGAHRQRQRALTRAGWRLVDAYPSRWDRDPVRAALDLRIHCSV